jgi:cysteinylglycine-S-conjugate dipeptidase
MNRIQMYTSSSDLRCGLHRVLAVSNALSEPLSAGENTSWDQQLPNGGQQKARLHRLSLEELADLFQLERIRQTVELARSNVGLIPPIWNDVEASFKAAIISGRAHKLHGGRDVYGISNKTVWDLLCSDFGKAVADRFGTSLGDGHINALDSIPSEKSIAYLDTLCSFDTSPRGAGHGDCTAWLQDRLKALGFHSEILGEQLGRPLIKAHRPSKGLRGHVVLYGHYDTTPFGRAEKWTHDARKLTLSDGRLHGRGVADNKGPLAARLATLEELEESPALTWLIQGEEETGSKVAHALLPEVMQSIRPTLWLEETGYHDHENGTLRLLAQIIGEDGLASDPSMELLLCGLRGLASRWGIASRFENRGLNKSVVAGGCPFNHNLPKGARYLAAGVNDSMAQIHAIDESLPQWTFPLHAAQLEAVFRWTHHVEGKR